MINLKITFLRRNILKKNILFLFMVICLTLVDARGKKKKSNSGNTASCANRGLDCSATCCLDTTCATDLADCAGYVNRDLNEIYIGVLTIVGLMMFIPCCFTTINFCMMYKFC